MNTTSNTICAAALVACALACAPAAAQSDYPHKPVRFIVGYAPGGVNDILARLLAPQLTASFGQQVVVDNRPGASGRIANTIAARATPDGHTMALVPTSFAIDIARGEKLPYDSARDFLPVSLVASSSLVLVVNPSVPAKTLQALLDIDRAKPGSLSYGHAGVGNLTHVAAEMLKSMTGTKMVAVAYKGGGPALRDVVAGRVQFGTPTIPPAIGHIRAGRLRPLAVTGTRPASILPDVPTIAGSGVPGYDASAWWALLVPAGTPQAVVDRLGREIVGALDAPVVKQRLAEFGIEPVGSSSRGLERFLADEVAKWRKTVESSGLRIR